MLDAERIAIIGGGPAGSQLAAALAQAGLEVVLFEERPGWEKPCGGGIPHKVLTEWPFLCNAEVERNWVRECELISPCGRCVSFHFEHPVAIFSRRVLNGLLLERARQAGAEICHERVVRIKRQSQSWCVVSRSDSSSAGYLVIASGAHSPFCAQLSRPLAAEDLMVTAGYYVPGGSQRMQIHFVANLHGYIWVFPRADHFSAGICGKLKGNNTGRLRLLLEDCLRRLGIDFSDASFYAHVLPCLRTATLQERLVNGDGWAMIGDAAGLVDPITGEGLYYAMRSAQLLSEALLAKQPERYMLLLRQDFLPELEMATRLSDRFYSGRWMGQPVIERMVQFTAHSATLREVMSDLFAGTQDYRSLKRRLYLRFPAIAVEALLNSLHFAGGEEVSVVSRV